ncbi:protein kinase [Paucibacter sp. KBW04]|uniref:protein kinase n=1 Tax=Paucibacter sp. KBW04 TaxID=2153361 RepID=UPI000F5814DD|nr:protein kinase [Paucibacter sp. KBW04]RQO62654.1 protein kinase [Paucibacter sp. KBW04]
MNTLEQLRTGQLLGTKQLKLACGLSEFPTEIFELAETLEVLDLSGNALSTLPADLPRLKRLRILFCSGNRFSELPTVLGRCEALEMVGFKSNQIHHVPAQAIPPQLRWFILTDNQIATLPAVLGQCQRLQKLALAGNRLSALPASMAACTRLELLRISANQFSELPDWLLKLPRLSWLAFGGNPINLEAERQALSESPLPSVAWQQLQLEQKLGEGASGVIYRAQLRGQQAVALKVFKGEVTSDGLPSSEMAAAIQAGSHPHLIPVQARLVEHPEQAMGLLMQLVASDFQSLAGPPSLQSCTRDVYADDLRIDLAQLLRLAAGIASAAQHLQGQGLLHGDLYAHNILHDRQAAALLGDFGAASFFDSKNPALAQALQAIEVRAFGCLLEELLERCEPTDSHQTALGQLRSLLQDCLNDEPAQRPSFTQIVQQLLLLSFETS